MSANETAEQAAVYAQEIMRQEAVIADLLRALRDTVDALEQVDRAIPGASFANCYEARQARAAIAKAAK